jgi:hypothetical protein
MPTVIHGPRANLRMTFALVATPTPQLGQLDRVALAGPNRSQDTPIPGRSASINLVFLLPAREALTRPIS